MIIIFSIFLSDLGPILHFLAYLYLAEPEIIYTYIYIIYTP